MLRNRLNKQHDVLFWLALIPLCLFLGSFVYLTSAVISYVEEEHDEKLYLNTTCSLNGTITLNEPCKDDINWWSISSHSHSSTFRLCLKTIYVIIYGNKQKAFTDKRPSWADDDETDEICYYDKTKSGILRWEKPSTKQYQIEILFTTLIFSASIILWIVWAHLKTTSQLRTMFNNDYHILPSEI